MAVVDCEYSSWLVNPMNKSVGAKANAAGETTEEVIY